MDMYYLSANYLIYKDKKIRVKRIRIGLSELGKFKPSKGKNLLLLNILPNELKVENGKKIISFLEQLRKKKVDFIIERPLPACLFGMNHLRTKKFGVPSSCKECLDFFTLEKGSIRFCEIMEFRMGPKVDYMRDKEQIYEYFKTFYDVLPKQKFCKRCVYNIRKKCYTCSRIAK